MVLKISELGIHPLSDSLILRDKKCKLWMGYGYNDNGVEWECCVSNGAKLI